jgi:hypothetical protein
LSPWTADCCHRCGVSAVPFTVRRADEKTMSARPVRGSATRGRPATFIYAGVDVEGSGLLAGTRGRQIAGRFGVIACQAFAYGTAAQRQEWQALIATLEQSLRLRRHAPGQLLKLAGYLHERTDGMIGSLSHLIRGAAVDAILDGTEKITRETLDRVGLDQAAEATRTRRKNARNRHGPSG